MMRKHVCRIIPPKAFCQFAPAANDALYPYKGRQRNYAWYRQRPYNDYTVKRGCVDRLSTTVSRPENSDARNDLFAAPVSSERVTEPFGGLHTAG